MDFDGLNNAFNNSQNAENLSYVGIKFCQEWYENKNWVEFSTNFYFQISNLFSNNMLYPREDRNRKVLLYACRNCEYSEESDNPCVYINKIKHDVEYVILSF